MTVPQRASLVAVTATEYDKAPAVFENAADYGLSCMRAPESEDGIAATVRENGAAHAVVGLEVYNDALFEALPSGGVVARFGVGYDALNLSRANQEGVLCTNTPGVLDQSVAEHAIGLIMSAVRYTPQTHHRFVTGHWSPRLGIELQDKTLAVIGCGRIGCRVARIAARGFGMRVVGCKARKTGFEELKDNYGFSSVTTDFAEAVSGADVVSLHLPATEATRDYIAAVRLYQIPSTAVLINTARGSIVDEVALYDALQAGELRAAALDAFDNEPYHPVDENRDLRELDNAVLTPHLGSSTTDACAHMARRTLENIRLAETKQYQKMDLVGQMNS